jgi:hypothetical protein
VPIPDSRPVPADSSEEQRTDLGSTARIVQLPVGLTDLAEAQPVRRYAVPDSRHSSRPAADLRWNHDRGVLHRRLAVQHPLGPGVGKCYRDRLDCESFALHRWHRIGLQDREPLHPSFVRAEFRRCSAA